MCVCVLLEQVSPHWPASVDLCVSYAAVPGGVWYGVVRGGGDLPPGQPGKRLLQLLVIRGDHAQRDALAHA